MKYINKHFTIEYNDKNIPIDVFNKFTTIYMQELATILQQFNFETIIPIYFFNKENLDEYVRENSISYQNIEIPSWLVGFSSSKVVCILEPSVDNINNMIRVALHESVHYILYNMYPHTNRSKLLDEGLSTYYGKQNYAYCLKQIKEDYDNNTLRNISDLCTPNSTEFAKIKGYSYCYYVLDFLISKFNIEKIFEWLNNIELFNSDINKLDLNTKFTEYLLKKISDVNEVHPKC